MVLFRCGRCHGDVAGPVREVPLPDADSAPAPYELPKGEECPPRTRPGTFAYDPPEAGERVFRPHTAGAALGLRRAGLSGIVLARADVRGTEPTTLRGRRNGCCGLDGCDGCDGPNLVCRRARPRWPPSVRTAGPRRRSCSSPTRWRASTTAS
ncbi:hypothetical protein [Streptomyces sp. NBRC 110028]|uniref:hypothetical protein n=1 Tax=Streptomyces sp. NBRC 110028 TaxID=1621260 RepID=UPI00131B9474|nr:hypothetical protein [Streptomyces sp. NBRC 110028]